MHQESTLYQAMSGVVTDAPPPVPLRETMDGPRRPLTEGEKILIREFRWLVFTYDQFTVISMQWRAIVIPSCPHDFPGFTHMSTRGSLPLVNWRLGRGPSRSIARRAQPSSGSKPLEDHLCPSTQAKVTPTIKTCHLQARVRGA